MIDIKLIRENKELVKENIKKKFQDKKLPLVDEVYDMDIKYRKIKTEADEKRSKINSLSKEIGNFMRNKDIDGANKGATQLGKDVFAFVYYYEHDGIIETLTVPRADNMAQYIGYLTPKSQNEGNFSFATGWIIDYGNMDYLKLTSEGKCPNGTVPTDANPSCK